LKLTSTTNYYLLFADAVNKIISTYFSSAVFERIFSVIDSNSHLGSKKQVKETLLDSAFSQACNTIMSLKETYMEELARATVNDCEILIKAGVQAGHRDVAALAGNLALIFRRMKNKNKTFEMHELSVKLFEASNKQHDSLIEMMNYATALYEFGNKKEAVDKLRDARQKANEAGEETIHASVCGNIASFLINSHEENASIEIEEMFKTEEHFFRKHSEYRSLVISLLNQVDYYKKTNIDTARTKFTEAFTLVRDHRLQEFYNDLRQMSE
jgi:tetratricopeptide (TPR) repeat protein